MMASRLMLGKSRAALRMRRYSSSTCTPAAHSTVSFSGRAACRGPGTNASPSHHKRMWGRQACPVLPAQGWPPSSLPRNRPPAVLHRAEELLLLGPALRKQLLLVVAGLQGLHLRLALGPVPVVVSQTLLWNVPRGVLNTTAGRGSPATPVAPTSRAVYGATQPVCSSRGSTWSSSGVVRRWWRFSGRWAMPGVRVRGRYLGEMRAQCRDPRCASLSAAAFQLGASKATGGTCALRVACN